MRNTKIEYLYRDADNYKKWNEVVIAGKVTEAQKRVILNSLESEEFFIPEQLGLPIIRPDDKLTAADHPFCELDVNSFSMTDEAPTVAMSANELTEAFRKAGKDGWDDITYAVDVVEEEVL